MIKIIKQRPGENLECKFVEGAQILAGNGTMVDAKGQDGFITVPMSTADSILVSLLGAVSDASCNGRDATIFLNCQGKTFMGLATFPAKSVNFPSAFAIGEPVYLEMQVDCPKAGEDVQMEWAKIPCHVRTVTFTNSKVRYSVRTATDQATTIHNIDSVFVEPRDGDRIDLGFDNYS